MHSLRFWIQIRDATRTRNSASGHKSEETIQIAPLLPPPAHDVSQRTGSALKTLGTASAIEQGVLSALEADSSPVATGATSTPDQMVTRAATRGPVSSAEVQFSVAPLLDPQTTIVQRSFGSAAATATTGGVNRGLTEDISSDFLRGAGNAEPMATADRELRPPENQESHVLINQLSPIGKVNFRLRRLLWSSTPKKPHVNMNPEAVATSFEHIPDMSPANQLKFDALFVGSMIDKLVTVLPGIDKVSGAMFEESGNGMVY